MTAWTPERGSCRVETREIFWPLLGGWAMPRTNPGWLPSLGSHGPRRATLRTRAEEPFILTLEAYIGVPSIMRLV